jgi:hypothetical protein
MKTYDFIRQAIGSKVYLVGDGDLGMDGTFRKFIYDKTELNLIGLTKGGMAVIEHEGKKYNVRPSNVREIGYTKP